MKTTKVKLIAFTAFIFENIGILGAGYGYAPEVFTALRIVGRLAMPLFIYLVADGLYQAPDRLKYASKLFLFALITEIPYDLFHQNLGVPTKYHYPVLFSMHKTNPLFTLALAALTVVLIDKMLSHKILKYGCFLPAVLFSGLAMILNVDYGAISILCVIVVYYNRGKWPKVIAMAITAILLRLGHFNLSLMQIVLMGVTLLPATIPLLCADEQSDDLEKGISKWTFCWAFPIQYMTLAAVWLLICVRLIEF